MTAEIEELRPWLRPSLLQKIEPLTQAGSEGESASYRAALGDLILLKGNAYYRIDFGLVSEEFRPAIAQAIHEAAEAWNQAIDEPFFVEDSGNAPPTATTLAIHVKDVVTQAGVVYGSTETAHSIRSLQGDYFANLRVSVTVGYRRIEGYRFHTDANTCAREPLRLDVERLLVLHELGHVLGLDDIHAGRPVDPRHDVIRAFLDPNDPYPADRPSPSEAAIVRKLRALGRRLITPGNSGNP